MKRDAKIFVAGGTGMVGSAIIRRLMGAGYVNIVSNYHRRHPGLSSFRSAGVGGGLDIVCEGPLFSLTGPSCPPVRFFPLDLTRQAETEAFFDGQRPDFVFFASARVGGIYANSTYKADFIYENLAMATNVIGASHRFGVAKLLNLGSSCIYPRSARQPLTEDALLTGALEATNEPYAIAKIAAIKLCRYYNEQYGTDFISLMPTNLYGPGDNFDLETSHVLPALIRKYHLGRLLSQGDFPGIKRDFVAFGNGHAATPDGTLEIGPGSPPEDVTALLARFGIAGQPPSSSPSLADDVSRFTNHASRLTQSPITNHQSRITNHESRITLYQSRITNHASRITNHEPRPVTVSLWGTGSPLREFLHVDDLAEASVYVMERFNHADMGEFVNVGTGRDLTIGELAAKVAGAVGFGGETVYDASMPDGTPQKLLDVSRMARLGWSASIGLEEGIGAAYVWYLEQ
jgi:GDP-L-fucose synthase